MRLRSRRPLLDCLLLAALCGVTYFFGLTDHGLSNWQEGVRALAAMEMQQRGGWLVPHTRDVVYINKPPLVYWCQLALAQLFSARITDLELRLTVALAGTLSVLLTYVVARSMLRDAPSRLPAAAATPADGKDWGPAYADNAAWWSALFLATGVLHVRSSRIGELDILLVPSVLLAVWGVWRWWRVRRGGGAWSISGLLMAAGGATLAGLTKGPPGILVIALAGFGGALLATAFGPASRPEPESAP